ncbi:hypothetical protein GLOIN_2v1662849 [Rhizophagus clarus]|uniref:Uncharacterized protein n=1 Tax=Rhizophagus clarus TaxID=94130 RepID=A0A8H3R315_9GLOM|nr:hypothetical protein GLOIN_2v1662849 [Rhizophagus clarus]
MTSTQETCTYKTYDEFAQHFIDVFFRSFSSSLNINPHIILNKTGIAEWKKANQRGFFTKTPELLPTVQQAKQKKLNEELVTEMDMDISSPTSHQSTSAQPHTTAVNSPIATTPKGKGKKKKHKHITISEEDIDKDFRLPVDSVDESTQALSSQLPSPPLHDAIKKVKESSAPLLDSNASKEKCLKVQDAEAAQVITGYQAPSGCQFVRDILIYDVPAKWDNYELLSHLSTWGIPTRWFLVAWNLAERKERQRFQAVIYDLPESINTALLTAPQHLTFFSELNIKIFKEIKFPDGSCKIVGYFETWEHL